MATLYSLAFDEIDPTIAAVSALLVETVLVLTLLARLSTSCSSAGRRVRPI